MKDTEYEHSLLYKLIGKELLCIESWPNRPEYTNTITKNKYYKVLDITNNELIMTNVKYHTIKIINDINEPQRFNIKFFDYKREIRNIKLDIILWTE